MAFEFKLTDLGDLRASAEADRKGFAEAMWAELKERGDTGLKAELRADIENSGMRNAKRLAKTQRGQIYPKLAKAHAAKPSYVASQRTDYLAGILQTGGTIRATGKLIPVPLDPARKFMRPGVEHSKLIAVVEQRLGRKLIVRRGSGGKLLLGDRVLKGKKQVAVFTAYFVLKQDVRLGAKLHSDAIFKRFGATFDAGYAGSVITRFETARELRTK